LPAFPAFVSLPLMQLIRHGGQVIEAAYFFAMHICHDLKLADAEFF
jgi:hypothetical protein